VAETVQEMRDLSSKIDHASVGHSGPETPEQPTSARFLERHTEYFRANQSTCFEIARLLRAARAREAGRGFAVVADEVRNLATGRKALRRKSTDDWRSAAVKAAHGCNKPWTRAKN